MPPLQGIWLPLVTPFDGNEIDFKSFDRLLNLYAQTNVQGLVIGGTTGEAHSLSEAELYRLVRRACDVVRPTMKILIGVTGSVTADVQAKARAADALPVDGLLVTAPAYVRPGQDGLVKHYAEIVNATRHSIVVYNIPYRTAVNIENDTIRALATIPNIIGLKDCCGDPEQSLDLLRNRPPNFSVLAGEDRNVLTALTNGADGAMSACAHIAPFDLVNVYSQVKSGNRAAAQAAFSRLSEMIELLFSEPNPMPLKHWLWREGLIRSCECRLPLTTISRDLADRIDALMERARTAHRHLAMPDPKRTLNGGESLAEWRADARIRSRHRRDFSSPNR